MKPVRATACSNIALVKYWGKRTGVSAELNLPAVGSLSMTLDALRTETELHPADADAFELDGRPVHDVQAAKVWRHLDRIWAASGRDGARPAARVVSYNRFPTAAGLASSASGFAALTIAAATAFGTDLPPAALSSLARQGSGSAARSIFGGFVRLHRGSAPDGSDCRARPLVGADHWPLTLLVVQTTAGRKPIGSTDGMERCRETSPYYSPWVATSEADLDAAEAALRARDLPALGRVVEHSCFKMHASMMATDPPLLYWNGTTVTVVHEVWQARAEGLSGYVTIDAGPHVKVLCEPTTATALRERLAAVPGVLGVIEARPGPDATAAILETTPETIPEAGREEASA
ncbi:diphosphomevalonate decarboxylase [Paraliomyxa miuraensis]|uniref:diphosphomevalonate decarboxylase n=1 Tax=Paraliomyxa miuraensis TaxID=376150 RepID=UPI00224E52F7|nr:diphosphomevalonate decarboxylase [Paraliomyxa miuraensis]MCX4244461.1 diphosphomevalonate decarboxylase [Paraliomyxa miuraensis]